MDTHDAKLKHIMDLDSQYYLNTFGKRVPFCPDHGDGVWLYGTDGRRYMDMIGGIAVNVVGHARTELTQAICRQAGNVIHCSNYYYNEPQAELAARLATSFGGGRVFICNSGAEANEGAIKLARGYFYKKNSPRTKIVTALQSFHGRTLATATATGQPRYSEPFAPLPEGFVYVPFNDCEALKSAVTDDTCAVMLELIQGESGVRPASQEFASLAAELCKQTGARLIIDEIQTGMGRTGSFYAYEGYGIKPDIVTLAKGLAGGVPIGALIANEDTSTGFAPGDHGSTFGGNPLACAAALAVLSIYDQESLVRRAAQLGRDLINRLREAADDNSKIKEVRGKGLMIGIELSVPRAQELKHKMFERGFLVGAIGTSTIRILPPLTITEEELDIYIDQFIKSVQEDI